MDSENKKKSKQPYWLYAILGVLAIALIVLLVRNSSMKSDLKTLEAEKEMQRADFQAEVDSLLKVHNDLKESYGELSLELAEKDSIIQADAVEIKKLLDSQWDYYRIKKKVESLQLISQKYVRQMDSLYTVNRELVAENERIREEYLAERRENTNLNRQKEELTSMVNQAATMKLFNYTAQAVRFRGGSKESITDRADRAERIRIDFIVAANDLIQSGSKVFYVRIADPAKAQATNTPSSPMARPCSLPRRSGSTTKVRKPRSERIMPSPLTVSSVPALTSSTSTNKEASSSDRPLWI